MTKSESSFILSTKRVSQIFIQSQKQFFKMAKIYILIATLLASILTPSEGKVLKPPYFNVAEVAKITSTATCGEQGPETYCRFTGPSSKFRDCNVCDSGDPNSIHPAHPIEYAIDGTERYWLSPTLKTGDKFEKVNITMDFGREYEVAYVFMTMGIAPRPAVWALERSTDFGVTWTPWQFFARNERECKHFFGDVEMNITKLDSVICETRFSQSAPWDSGEIVVSLLNYRPLNYPDHLSWARATNIRLRFLKMAELKGSPVDNQRRYYSIKDISIGGSCICNGHADTCEALPTSFDDDIKPKRLACRCENNTCGESCEKCCPGFRAVPWKQGSVAESFQCEPQL